MAFIAKKIVSAFILPPGIFIPALIAMAVFFLRRKRRLPAVAHLVMALFIWLSAIAPVAHALLVPLEHAFQIPVNPRGDVIVVLGGGAYRGVPDPSGTGAPNAESMIRMVAAMRLHRASGLPLIVSGGKAFAQDETEARLMRRCLVESGIPSGKIITEEASRDTRENAVNVSRICRERNFRRPILVTSAYHMKRAVKSFRKAGMEVVPYPAGHRTAIGNGFAWQDLLPTRIQHIEMAIREYIGLMAIGL